MCTYKSQAYIISYHSDIVSEHLEIIQLIHLYPAELQCSPGKFRISCQFSGIKHFIQMESPTVQSSLHPDKQAETSLSGSTVIAKEKISRLSKTGINRGSRYLFDAAGNF